METKTHYYIFTIISILRRANLSDRVEKTSNLYKILSPTANVTMYNFNNSKCLRDLTCQSRDTLEQDRNQRGWKEWKTKCHVVKKILECSKLHIHADDKPN